MKILPDLSVKVIGTITSLFFLQPDKRNNPLMTRNRIKNSFLIEMDYPDKIVINKNCSANINNS
jgi:hypothetical protein